MTIKYHRLVRPFRPAGTPAMQGIFVAALLQVIACAATAQPGSGPSLRLVTEDYAPYAWKSDSGELRGVSTDIVRELLQRAQVPVPTPELLPWARAYSIALHTPRACLFSTVRNLDREGFAGSARLPIWSGYCSRWGRKVNRFGAVGGLPSSVEF
jgi:hypothetical protein